MEVRPIENSFAAEVEGLALWRALDEAAVEALRRAWWRHGLLVFRRQALSEDELVAFSRRFGAPERIVRADWASRLCPEVTYVSNMRDDAGRPIGGLGTGELAWHSDQSYMAAPATGAFLYGAEIPGVGGRTFFADLRRAYAALPGATKRRIAGLSAVFSYAKRVSGYEGEQPSAAEIRDRTPDVTHPLVNRHPVTGEKSLYLDPSTTIGVEGMAAAEGARLLARLDAHATAPEFVHGHDWRVGDLLMWDNGVLLHRREPYDASRNRLLKRATVNLPPDRFIVPAARPAAG